MRSKSIRVACIVFLAVLCLTLHISSAATEKPIELKFSMWNSLQHSVYVEIYGPFAQELEKRTNGRAKIVFYPGETLGKTKDHYDLVSKGIADIAIFIQAATPGRFPLTSVMELPIGVPSSRVGSRAVWELYEKYLKQEYPGVKVLGLKVSEPGQIHMTKAPIKTVAGLQGLRLRSPGPQQTAVLRALGASPLNIAATELYDALQKGMADGALLPFTAIKDFKLEDVLRHHTIANMYVMTSGVAINLNVWNKLPPDVQKVIEELTGEKMVERNGEQSDRNAQLGVVEAKKRGDFIYDLPPAEKKILMEKAKPLNEAWIAQMEKKGLPGRKVFDEAVRLVDKYAEMERRGK